MKPKVKSGQTGQATVEFVLILVLVVLIALVALGALGVVIRNSLGGASNAFTTVTPSSSSTAQILADFQARIQDYYKKYGRWPRTFSPYNFTDLGLNPSDWDHPVNGLYFSPHGSEVGIANRKGDNFQVYVQDLNSKTLQLYDGWSIWCPVNSANCYYHTVAPGNEINISTLFVTGQ
jgi:hypothetical protein